MFFLDQEDGGEGVKVMKSGYLGLDEALGKTNKYPFEIEVGSEMGLC